MKRVVISGLGVISSIGSGHADFWKALLSGKSGISNVRSFDTSQLPVHLGGEIHDFSPAPYFRRQDPAHVERASQLAIAAASLALADAGIDAAKLDGRRAGVSMGTTSGEPLVVEQYNDAKKAGGWESIPGEILPKYPCSAIPSNLAVEYGLRGPCLMIPTACAAGNYAIGYGFDAVRAGRADVMLCGGADAFSRITYMGFARLGAIAPDTCRPFDRNRKGMVPGEGAAILVLEPLDRALARGATVYAEVLGYAVNCDSHHMTAAHPQGDGAIRAMKTALTESGLGTDDVGYISAHGTGTPTNDRVECIAVRTLFGERSSKVPISSIKSMLGHTMGAASAIEALACALALKTGVVPPTMNYQEPDPECEVDCVPNQPRTTNPRVALNNAYAFGGNNASLCLARCDA